ncbi:MAG: gluconate 2-dehydrogenase subunit 3 family protein [Burkholderiaceae bacterium]
MQDDAPPAPRPAATLSRRRLLAGGAAVVPIVSAAAVLHQQLPWAEGAADMPLAAPEPPSGYVFFRPAEAAFVEAAVARLIPADELGPGAFEAGVPFFIDRQLAGAFGRAESWYMQGPWGVGEPTQGYQTRLTPAELYRAAIAEIDQAVAAGGGAATTFARLEAQAQDEWLHRLEQGTLALRMADARTFFKMLWQNTVEGFWSDPLYGGNRGMVGWKLIGFAGARYNHLDFVEHHGEPYPLPPVGLRGRPDWSAPAA